MKAAIFTILAVMLLTAVSAAKELPEAPSTVMMRGAMATPLVASPAVSKPSLNVEQPKVVDMKFMSLAIVSTGVTFADSYTTLFATQNWKAGKQGVCNAEVQSAYLYGTHPTAGRAYAVASAKSLGAVAASYYMRKHHNKFWSLPLVANSIIGLQGTTQNMMACN